MVISCICVQPPACDGIEREGGVGVGGERVVHDRRLKKIEGFRRKFRLVEVVWRWCITSRPRGDIDLDAFP